MVYADFLPADLPPALQEAFSDERLLFLILQTPPKDSSQEDGFITCLNFMLDRISKPDFLLHGCPRLFSWSSRVLLKSCPRGFGTFCDWFKKVHPEGKSLLEAEVELQDNKNKLLVDLISEGRFEIIANI